jgi:hypothetical protein
MQGEYLHLMYSDIFEREKARARERRKEFKRIKTYKNFELCVHKKYGYRECFPKNI